MDNDEQNLLDQPEDVQETPDSESSEQKQSGFQDMTVTKDAPIIEKSKMSAKKRIGIISSIILLVVAISIGGLYYWNITTTKKAEEDYRLNLQVTQALLLEGAIADVGICGQYSTVWSNAIDSSYKDFNIELADQKSKNDRDGTFVKSNKTKDSIDEGMRKLNNPQLKFQKTYEKLLEMYGIYSKIHSQAIDPSGSLLTFNQNINSLQDDFLRVSNELKVITPEVPKS